MEVKSPDPVADFVTVVTVGTVEEQTLDSPAKTIEPSTNTPSSAYVTVLKIGDTDKNPNDDVVDAVDPDVEITEEVLVYRLPGERLGFGLKFEGGTKSAEFVKRLFIQSCAPDSPASRVHSSWGCLTEGDEVLQIDSIPVNNMTRIDCVRCLKDSNVVIKLIVKHFPLQTYQVDDIVNIQLSDLCSKSAEDIPHVVSAEKKRTPPPPPPIPPRKVSRKSLKEIGLMPKTEGETPPVPPARHTNLNTTVKIMPSQRLQSPRNSGRSSEIRDSHLGSGPPDAEVYLDLFAHEQEYSLRTESESDDTGSSISTIVDRLSSFPTTSNSSFSDSLPSTPTALKKRMDLTLLNPFDNDEFHFDTTDDYLVTKLMSSENYEDVKQNDLKRGGGGLSLQPPANFQDAPLSCGNEDVRVMEANLIMTKINNNVSCEEDVNESSLTEIQVKNMRNVNNEKEIKKAEVTFRSGKKRPPPPPPNVVVKDVVTIEKNNNYIKVDEAIKFNLPRLVDFVPKRSASDEHLECMEEVVKSFLENEIKSTSGYDCMEYRTDVEDVGLTDSDNGNYFWSPCVQLATIGEDEEENNLDCTETNQQKTQKTSVVIIENVDERNSERVSNGYAEVADNKYEADKTMDQHKVYFGRSPSNLESSSTNSDSDGTMEVPPSSSRQPPDGDEFPISYQENTSIVNETPSRIISVPKPILPYNFNTIEETKPKLPPTRSTSRDPKVTSVKDKIAIFSSQIQEVPPTLNTSSKFSRTHKSSDDVFKNLDQVDFATSAPDSSDNSVESYCLDVKAEENPSSTNGYYSLTNSIDRKSDDGNETRNKTQRLHTRSQSLIDVTSLDQTLKADKWTVLMEQRRKGMSKLKGLVIPERVVEVEAPVKPIIDLPEIKSKGTLATLPELKTNDKLDGYKPPVHQRHLSNPSFVIPPLNAHVIPKYSPAFKRKSLQVYSVPNTTPSPTVVANKETKCISYNTESVFTTECHLPVTNLPKSLPLNDAPKSLESITSPTRSDCSFEYICSSPDMTTTIKSSVKPQHLAELQEIKIKVNKTLPSQKTKDVLDGSDNESDNDSAVSSSQSSYCRCSPPMSPNDMQTNVYETSSTVYLSSSEYDKSADDQEEGSVELQSSSKYNSLSRRVLKPQSVDAINRKNILASAKCRSGRDLKVGSPLIQRKFDEDENASSADGQQRVADGQDVVIKQVVHYSVTSTANKILDNVNIAYVNVDVTVDAERVEDMEEKIFTDCATTEIEHNHVEEPIVYHKKEEPQEPIVVKKERSVSKLASPVVVANPIENLKTTRDDLKKVIVPKTSSIENHPTARSHISNAKASVNDIKKSFEKMTPVPALRHSITTPKIATRVVPTKRLSLDAKTIKTQFASTTNTVTHNNKISTNNNNNIKSEVNRTKQIPDQTIQELIRNNNIDDKQEVIVVVLRRESVELSIGITLAGGSDYETKEITVHSVRKASPAYLDGRISKGDRILAINGVTMKDATHGESISLLKSPSLEVTLVVCKCKNAISPPIAAVSPRRSSIPTVASRSKESLSKVVESKGTNFEVCLTKDIGGLGFSISGGQDSPLGDMPLLIKKLFKGGVADKSGKLFEGDQLLAVNGKDVSNVSRIEAWGLMKKLPEGSAVTLTVKR